MAEPMDLPPLFDRRGAWVGYDSDMLASLSDERRATYAELEAVALALADKEAAIKALQENIADAAAHCNACRAAMPKPMTQTQLAKEWIASHRPGT